MSIHDQFGDNVRVAVYPVAVPTAHRPEPMRVAELSFTNGWASDIATRQLFNVNGYATVGGRTVTHGAVGFSPTTGAHGIRPIFMPGGK